MALVPRRPAAIPAAGCAGEGGRRRRRRRVWSETFSSQAAAAAATGRAVSHARQEPPGRDRCGFPSRRLKPPGALQGAAPFSAANPLEPFRSFRGRLGGCRFPQFCVTSCAVPPLPGEGSRAGVWAAAGPRVALLSCQGARPETGLAWAGAYGLCSSPSGGLGGAQCLREGSEGGGRARLGRMREGSERPGCRWGGEGGTASRLGAKRRRRRQRRSACVPAIWRL